MTDTNDHDLPPMLTDLPPGEYQVVLKRTPDGDRQWVIYDTNPIAARLEGYGTVMTDTSARYIDPEIDRTLDALTSRHPAIEVHAQYIRDRLAELAQHCYQHGEIMALSTLISPSDAQHMLGVSPSQLSYLARKHDVGWNTGSGHRVYRLADIETLRQIRRDNPPGHYDRTRFRKA